MLKKYFYYNKVDLRKEPISKIVAPSRLKAAKYFAAVKRMSLKKFLQIWSVSR